MGFNLMNWNFLQYDAYNGVATSMSQRDQQAASENLAATLQARPGSQATVSTSLLTTQGVLWSQ